MSLRGSGTRQTLSEIAPVWRILGCVSDPQGRPIEHARVVTCDANGAEVFSAADGSFELEVQAGRCVYLLRVQHEGCAETRIWVTETGSDAHLEIELSTGGQVLGLVQDWQGTAIEGAELSHCDRRARSKRDGSFMIADLPAGQQRLRAKATGYAPCIALVNVAAGETRAGLSITLQPGHDLYGRLLDQLGEPVASALVCAQVEALDSASRSTFSDLQGRFLLRDLPGDPCKVEISGAGFDTVVMPVQLDGTEIEIQLAIEPAEPGPQSSRISRASGESAARAWADRAGFRQ